MSGGLAKRSVLAALSATTDSGDFAFTYQLSESPVQNNADSEHWAASAPGARPQPDPPEPLRCRGRARSTRIRWRWRRRPPSATNGVSGLQVGVRVDPTTVWEVGYADNGLTPVSSDTGAGGSPLAGFAGLVEGTLGSAGRPGRHDGHGQPDRVPRPRPARGHERHRGWYGDGRRGGGHAVPVGDRPGLTGHGARHELRGAECDQCSGTGAHVGGLSNHPRPRLH